MSLKFIPFNIKKTKEIPPFHLSLDPPPPLPPPYRRHCGKVRPTPPKKRPAIGNRCYRCRNRQLCPRRLGALSAISGGGGGEGKGEEGCYRVTLMIIMICNDIIAGGDDSCASDDSTGEYKIIH